MQIPQKIGTLEMTACPLPCSMHADLNVSNQNVYLKSIVNKKKTYFAYPMRISISVSSLNKDNK